MTNHLMQKSPYEADEQALIGRDPRAIAPEEWDAASTPYLIGLRAVRAKCLDCCCDNAAEVRKCVGTTCSLWPLRMASVPKGFRSYVEGQKAANDAHSDPLDISEGGDTRDGPDALHGAS